MGKGYNSRHMKMLTGAYGLQREDAENIIDISGNDLNLMFETAQVVKNFSIDPIDAKRAIEILGGFPKVISSLYRFNETETTIPFGEILNRLEAYNKKIKEKEMLVKSYLGDPIVNGIDPDGPDHTIELLKDPDFIDSLFSREDRISERKDPVNPENFG